MHGGVDLDRERAVLVASTTPPVAAAPSRVSGTVLGRKSLAFFPYSRSTLSLATLIPELTVRGRRSDSDGEAAEPASGSRLGVPAISTECPVPACSIMVGGATGRLT